MGDRGVLGVRDAPRGVRELRPPVRTAPVSKPVGKPRPSGEACCPRAPERRALLWFPSMAARAWKSPAAARVPLILSQARCPEHPLGKAFETIEGDLAKETGMPTTPRTGNGVDCRAPTPKSSPIILNNDPRHPKIGDGHGLNPLHFRSGLLSR